ncbi:MAG: A24 family peptidase [Gammaproteobacteria bacterium]|nr:A24 family peptidase [Gammaproteobacteria bacterium]
MSVLELIGASPVLAWSFTAVLGLVVGSFLNVVILRLPPLLEYRWREEFASLEVDAASGETTPPPPGLVLATSRCPACNAPIRPWHNIPLLGYLWLRGRCADCKAAISPRYPLIEVLAALLACLALWRMGWSPQLLPLLVLLWGLLTLSIIDLEHQLLPDVITLPLLWLGLLLNSFGLFAPLASSVWGAAAAWLSLWLVYQLFLLATGKEGMGYGDFKLFAVFGAWGGWPVLVPTILVAALSGLLVAGVVAATGRDARQPMPFGPALALGGIVVLLWRSQILGLLGLGGLA